MRKYFLLPILLFLSMNISAQKEYHKWYFGNHAAIDFVPGTATAITNSAMNSTDCPATISDSIGNLLFYSNGLQVWNRNHVVMSNGSGLLGNNSGGHTGTAVRKPGSTNLYYLFTMDAFAGSNGLRYNVIDMNLNGGLGDIVAGQKNISLISSASEQIVPVIHSNNTDIWIVTHPWNSGSFNSYLITSAGINLTPVISSVGTYKGSNSDDALGEMTVNEAHNRIATATYGSNFFELFNFNNSTGVLSNTLKFTGYTKAWGIEFSPNGNKLYLTGWTTQYVYQFDISTYTQVAIAASQVNLGNVTGPAAPYFTAYMQRGPDGKIYISVYADPYLAVINNPNANGVACNLVDSGFYLAGKTSGAGLPDKVVVTHSCLPIVFSLGNDTSYCGNFSRLLSTGDPNTIWSTGATGAQINVTTAGTYWASVSGACVNASDTITLIQKISPVVNLGNDTALCTGNSVILYAGNTGTSYLWQDGATGSNYTVSSPGNYSVTVTNAVGCSSSDLLSVTTLALSVSIISTNTNCGFSNGSVIVTVNNGNAPYNYQWSNNNTNDTILNLAAGNYSVTVQDAAGCSSVVSAVVLPSGNGAVHITTDKNQICATDSVHICTLTGYQNYIWNTGATDSCISTSLAGNYYVTVTDNGNCTASSNHIAISVYPQPPVSISVNGDSLYAYNSFSYQWYFNGNEIVGATSPLYVAVESGNYSVQVTDTNGCTALSIPVAVIATGIYELTSGNVMSVFPNPFQNEFTVYCLAFKTYSKTMAELLDINGRVVYTTLLSSENNKLKVDDLENGFYLLRIKTGENFYLKRLVKL